MLALRAAARNVRQLAAVPRQAVNLQQKRCMGGGDDDDHLYVNWWDAPSNPDAWHKHHLAWAAFGFWGIIFGFAFSGGKKEESKAAA